MLLVLKRILLCQLGSDNDSRSLDRDAHIQSAAVRIPNRLVRILRHHVVSTYSRGLVFQSEHERERDNFMKGAYLPDLTAQSRQSQAPDALAAIVTFT